MSKRLNRRDFVKGTLAAAATVTIAGTKSSARVLGSNDTVRVAVAGLHGRGSAHIGAYAGMQGVQITHLVDPDTRTYDSRIRQVRDRAGNTPRTEQDIRRVLESRDVDAVSIATPNHWHSLMTIWACQAGKDVYVEKPCSHNVHEGRVAVEMARQHNRIVQHGTQSRSEMNWARVVEVIRSGQLGRLLVARGLCYKRRGSIGQRPVSAPPREVNFDLWLGPAQETPFHTNLVHYNWHWFWDFGNGDIGNQGVHQMDIARWGIPGATLPRSVISLGGRFGYEDQGQTPNTQVTVFDYGPNQPQLIFEVRGLPSPAFHGQQIGNIFHLEEGIIAGNRFYPRGRTEATALPNVENVQRGPGGSHFGNFIAAVRSRRRADQNADILEGHYSSALCHLANISYRLGEQVPFNPRTRAFQGNEAATETLARMEEHLRSHEVPLQDTTCRVGPRLAFDPQEERFTGNDQANALLTRNYRRPYNLPERS